MLNGPFSFSSGVGLYLNYDAPEIPQNLINFGSSWSLELVYYQNNNETTKGYYLVARHVGANEIFSIGVEPGGEIQVHFKFTSNGSKVYKTGIKSC